MSIETEQELRLAPATADDLPFIEETVQRLRLDPEDLDPQQFITLRRADRIVAFGRIKPYEHTHELASVAVLEDERGRGLGARVVRELIDRFPQEEVYITTDMPTYFERFGFLQTDILPRELDDKLARVCTSLRPGTIGMVYDRRIERLPTMSDVYHAKHVLERFLPRTPLLRNAQISRELGCDAYIKYENLLPIGAFKVRGGVYLAATLSDEQKARGIIGASTGNHGQSLAYGARLAGARCIISVPEDANKLKVVSMRTLGADVQFHGADFEEARQWAEDYAREHGMYSVHHINALPLVTGVSTMSLEILEDLPDVDVIITPIGGGSGAVGHCLVAKEIRPSVEVIGVQTAGAPAVYNSWRDRRLQPSGIHTHAEGLATGRAYYIAVKTFIDRMDDMLLVTEEEIRDAVVLLLRYAHQVAEESGAAALAGAIKLRDRLQGKKVAIILSGGNMTLDRLQTLLTEHAASHPA